MEFIIASILFGLSFYVKVETPLFWKSYFFKAFYKIVFDLTFPLRRREIKKV